MRKLWLIAALLALAGVAAAADYEIPPGGNIPTDYTLQSGATSTANGNTINFHGGDAVVGCLVKWGSTTSKGAITFEVADSASYAGTWALFQTVTWGAASTETHYGLSGVKIKVFRARVSVASDGNGVTVVCNGRAY